MQKSRYNIVLIEDNKVHTEYILSVLQEKEYNVKTFENGRTAITYLKSPEVFPDAVLTDNYLSDTEGTRIIEYFTKHGYNYAFIILTGSNSIDLAVKAMKLGALNYIAKSLNLKDELSILVEKTILHNRDLLHKKDLEKQLQDREELFRRHYQNLPVPTFTWRCEDGDFVLIEYNQSASKLTDNNISQMLHARASTIFQAKPSILHRLHECYNTKQLIQAEENYTFISTGKTKFLKTTYVSVSDDIIMVHMEDISERRIAQQKLLETYNQLKIIFETIPAAINIIDETFTITECNERMLEILNKKRKEEVVGEKCCLSCKLKMSNNCAAPSVIALEQDVRVTGSNVLLNERVYKVFTNPIMNSDGQHAGFVEIIVDITAEKEVEEKLRELNATKDKLFSIIGHDLRSPIGGLKKLLELILKSLKNSKTERLSEMLEVTKSTANSVYYLLENLLSWAKSQSNEVSFKPNIWDFSEICNESVQLFTDLALQKNIALLIDVEPGTMVYADRNMLSTILRNLLSNAIKFSQYDKKVHISAQYADMAVEIAVKDEGRGISAEDKQKLFNRSHFFSTFGTGGEKGSGLGLVLCKEFVDKHSGRIWVDSELGKGSCFRFTLPDEASMRNWPLTEG